MFQTARNHIRVPRFPADAPHAERAAPVPQESGDDRLRRERDSLMLRYGFPGL